MKKGTTTFSSQFTPPVSPCFSTELLSCGLVLQQFTQLLEQQATIDQYAEWASNLVDTCLKVNLSDACMIIISWWVCDLVQRLVFNVLEFLLYQVLSIYFLALLEIF